MNLITLNSQAISDTPFADFMQQRISMMQEGIILTAQKRKYNDSTLRAYKNAHVCLLEFQQEEHVFGNAKCKQITGDYLLAYERFLIGKNLTKNSVSHYLSKVKAIALILTDMQVIANTFRMVKAPAEQTTKVSLSFTELKAMRDVKQVTDNETAALDTFTIQCLTGMRYSTIIKFLNNPLAYIYDHEGAEYIDIIADKTSEQSVIPLHETVKQILENYQWQIPTFTERFLNIKLKEIAEKAAINRTVMKRITIGGETVETPTPKHKLISTHTARRTFITQLKRHTTNNEAIMQATGHKSEQMLSNYVTSTKLEKVMPIMNNEFFRTGI